MLSMIWYGLYIIDWVFVIASFVQSICEYYNLPYIGATPNVRALVEDKSMSKQLAEHLQIPTAKWVVASSKYP